MPECSNSISKIPSIVALKEIFSVLPPSTSLRDVVAVDVDLLVLGRAHAEAHGLALVEAELLDLLAGQDRAGVDGRLRRRRGRRASASRPGAAEAVAVASPWASAGPRSARCPRTRAAARRTRSRGRRSRRPGTEAGAAAHGRTIRAAADAAPSGIALSVASRTLMARTPRRAPRTRSARPSCGWPRRSSRPRTRPRRRRRGGPRRRRRAWPRRAPTVHARARRPR